MIYTSPIESITWLAVEEFLSQGIKENSYVDYKENWPDKLARTIAAMANTLGGVILLGVEENDDASPKVPAVGVSLERGMSERVTNIVVSSITPPVFPAVQVCANTDGSRAIVVIRVPQSHQAPHAVMGDRRIYVRTNDRNKPEELATMRELEWLREHRAKALELRNRTYQIAVDRSDLFLGYTTRPYPGSRTVVPESKPYLLACAAPYYPRDTLVTPPTLQTLAREIRVRDYYGTDQEFPIGGARGHLLQDGVYLFEEMKRETGERAYYTEFSVFGQFFYRQTLTYKRSGDRFLRSSEIFARLDQFMRVAKGYLERLGLQGNVWFHVLMGSLGGSTLGQWEPNERVETTTACHDEAVAFETTLTMTDWDSQSAEAIGGAAQKIAWAYDWNMPADLVASYLAKNRRA